MRHHRPRIVTGTENRTNPRKGRVDLCWYPPGTFIRPLRSYAQVRQFLLSVWNVGGKLRSAPSSGSAQQDLLDLRAEERQLRTSRRPVAWQRYRELQKRRKIRERRSDELLQRRVREGAIAADSAANATAALMHGSSGSAVDIAAATEAAVAATDIAVAAAEAAAAVAMRDIGTYRSEIECLLSKEADGGAALYNMLMPCMGSIACGAKTSSEALYAAKEGVPENDRDAHQGAGSTDVRNDERNSTVFDGMVIHESSAPIVAQPQAPRRSVASSGAAHSASCTSRYRGVSMTSTGQWRCTLYHNGKTHDLGVHKDELVAARAFDDACRKHKRNWHLFCNFPERFARGNTSHRSVSSTTTRQKSPPLFAVVPGWGNRRLRLHASGRRFSGAKGRFVKSKSPKRTRRVQQSVRRRVPAARKRRGGAGAVASQKKRRGHHRAAEMRPRRRRPSPGPRRRDDMRPQRVPKPLGYDTASLTWLDAAHRKNKEKTYCYCGGPWDDVCQPAVQCHDCRQWFHVACLDMVKELQSSSGEGEETNITEQSPVVMLCGDGAYSFRCASCSDDGNELLERHVSSWLARNRFAGTICVCAVLSVLARILIGAQ